MAKSLQFAVVTLAAWLPLCGCGVAPPASPDAGADQSPAGNIAPSDLPGAWEVVGEPVVFTFDQSGIPVAIRNTEAPNDWRTNIEFGTPQRIETPLGAADIVFEPGQPSIDGVTGEAKFDAVGTGSDIRFLFFAIPGEGRATFSFTGQYEAEADELTGTIDYAVYLGPTLIYSDQGQPYTLRKTQP